MRRSSASLFFGILAICCASSATYATRVRMPGSGHILKWLDAHGLISLPDPSRQQEWSSSGIVRVTDGTAIEWLFLHSWWFGVVAMVLALWSESRSEDSLYAGAGYVCGALALALLNPNFGVASMLLGLCGLAWVRRGSGA
jgi:hypothetical protein